jgi:hypothetical protein
MDRVFSLMPAKAGIQYVWQELGPRFREDERSPLQVAVDSG